MVSENEKSGGIPLNLGNVVDAAAMAKCSPGTISNLVNRGHLTRYRVGRSPRIDMDELAEYIRNGPRKKSDPPDRPPKSDAKTAADRILKKKKKS